MPVLPQLEFVLLPGTVDKFDRGLIRLERVARKMQNAAHSEDVARKSLEEWRAGNLDYFKSGAGLNRLISLLLNEGSLVSDMNFQGAISTCIQIYSSKTAVYGLMSWCKSNWNSEQIGFYRSNLLQAVDELKLLTNEESKLKHGIGPLLSFLVDRDGPENFAILAENHPEGWTGVINKFKLRDSEVSGDFFMIASKNYLQQLIELARDRSWDQSEIMTFLEHIKASNLHSRLLYLTSLAITTYDEYSLDHEALQKFTLDNLGEVNGSKWLQVDNLSGNEQKTVQHAKAIIESWITELFLERFWGLIDDKGRRRFWKKYQKHMRNVHLAISNKYWSALPDDLRSIQYKSRLHSTSENALLIFSLKNRTFIEFGERASGPLQVIEHGSKQEKRLNRLLAESIRTKHAPQITNPQYLKFYSRTDTILIDKNYRMREYGKLNHSGNWEEKLSYWLKRKGL